MREGEGCVVDFLFALMFVQTREKVRLYAKSLRLQKTVSMQRLRMVDRHFNHKTDVQKFKTVINLRSLTDLADPTRVDSP